MEVVLPTPLTPITSTTEGRVARFSAGSPTRSFSARISRRQAFTGSWPEILSSIIRARSSLTASVAVPSPTSARMSISSRSSKNASSASLMAEPNTSPM